jgi:hypothetical protein
MPSTRGVESPTEPAMRNNPPITIDIMINASIDERPLNFVEPSITEIVLLP